MQFNVDMKGGASRCARVEVIVYSTSPGVPDFKFTSTVPLESLQQPGDSVVTRLFTLTNSPACELICSGTLKFDIETSPVTNL